MRVSAFLEAEAIRTVETRVGLAVNAFGLSPEMSVAGALND